MATSTAMKRTKIYILGGRTEYRKACAVVTMCCKDMTTMCMCLYDPKICLEIYIRNC